MTTWITPGYRLPAEFDDDGPDELTGSTTPQEGAVKVTVTIESEAALAAAATHVYRVESFPVKHGKDGRFLPGPHAPKSGGGGKGGGGGDGKIADTAPAPRHGMGDIPLDAGTVADLRRGGGSAADHIIEHPDGTFSFTPERQAMHDKIIQDSIAGQKPSDNPTFNVLGGGPAAGKSTMIDSGRVEQLKRPAVMVNPDEMKAKIPEYNELVRKKDPTAATVAHEESSYLAKRQQAASFEHKYDVTLDGTGDSSASKLNGKLDAARKAGYQVHGFYVTVPTADAVARANARGAKTGRYVAESVIKETHSAVSRVLPETYPHFDSVELYDTSGPSGSLTRVMSSKGSSLEIHDQGLWDTFLAKGSE